MDILMGSGAVLAGAVAIAVACMLLWGTVRALGDGRFVAAVLFMCAIGVGAYYGKQGYAIAAKRFAATDFAIDLRSPVHVDPGEWSGDVKRMVGPRNAELVTRDARSIRMSTQTIELRKRDDEVASVWLCSDRLISDDAADLAKQAAYTFDLDTDRLDAWANRQRHTLERDPQGWTVEKRRKDDYIKLSIDPDQHGYWWFGVTYVK